ncbi:MAG: hypothetical protein HY319_09970 [Armatimonadetes bacterium]|nr:hypothetical protein [Armatimonadota bacterium]
MPIPTYKIRTSCQAKNDKLGWKDGLAAEVFGLTIGIRTDRASLFPRLKESLPPGWKPSDAEQTDILLSFKAGGATQRKGVRNYYIVYTGWTTVVRTLNEEEALIGFDRLVEVELAAASRELTFVRAGAVSWNDAAVLICTPRDEHLTAAVDAFVAAGGRRMSDQFALVDAEGRIHPYGNGFAEPREPRLVLVVENLGTAGWRGRTLSPGKGTLSLIERTPSATVAPERALEVLPKVAMQSRVVQGKKGTPEELVRYTRRTLGAARH